MPSLFIFCDDFLTLVKKLREATSYA